MGTVDKTVGAGVKPAFGGKRVYVIENTIDLAAVATGDVVQCLDIKAKQFVFDVFVEVITATGLTSTATVGDGSAADGWDASTNLNATAATVTHGASGTDAYATSGKYYSAADSIDLTCTITAGPVVTGSVKVMAIVADLS